MKEYRVIVNGEEYLVEIEETTIKPVSSNKGPISKKNEEKILTQKSIVNIKEKFKNDDNKDAKYIKNSNENKENKENRENKVKEEVGSNSNELEIITAPIPGTIFTISVKEGDQVLNGDVLLILEAMKMENEILATKNGVIREIKVKQGASVNVGDILVTIE